MFYRNSGNDRPGAKGIILAVLVMSVFAAVLAGCAAQAEPEDPSQEETLATSVDSAGMAADIEKLLSDQTFEYSIGWGTDAYEFHWLTFSSKGMCHSERICSGEMGSEQNADDRRYQVNVSPEGDVSLVVGDAVYSVDLGEKKVYALTDLATGATYSSRERGDYAGLEAYIAALQAESQEDMAAVSPAP